MKEYIVLFVVIALCSTINLFVEKKKIKWLYLVCVVYLIFFTGFRDGVGGYDVENYRYYFQEIKPVNEINSLFDFLNYRFEILYTILNSIIKALTLDYKIVFLICSIISISLISNFNYKYSYYPFLSLLYFLYKLFIYGNMVAVRQSVSIAIFLFSLRYIEKNKFMKYLFCIIIASGFHISAVILIPIFFLKNIEFKKIGFKKILIITLTILLVAKPLLRIITNILAYILPNNTINKLFIYTSQVYFTKTSLLNIVEVLGIIFLLYIFSSKEDENLIIKGSYLNFIMVVSFIMFSFMGRVNLYFGYFFMISISYIIKYIKNVNIKILMYIFFVFIFFVGFIYDIKTFDSGSMENYKNWIVEGLR